MRTSFVFIRTGDGSDAFCPHLLLHCHGNFVLPAVWILFVLLREIERKALMKDAVWRLFCFRTEKKQPTSGCFKSYP
jgi:hypothetical protein